ncbi:hypothetical protein FRC98_00960 [Lujinxingia vulgaris]|uniref:Uncharacterized protein n=1 Tax=Lujinxingia vulgaris TaxID=2600176 RepID=A0A5C6XET4_9DELT|nr:hypothetical protein [Lujinxingia vulgaris]TXD39003.1 hypothetical protein FRC98_00960 [Lujinxingia vulgaris]
MIVSVWKNIHDRAWLTLAIFAVALMGAACSGADDDSQDDPFAIDQSGEVCFANTLDIDAPTASTMGTASSRREWDSELLCWTYDREELEGDQVRFTLSRTFSVSPDGRRFGCRLDGQGNALRGEITSGSCVIEQEQGFLRMELREPAEISLQDIHSTSALLNFTFEERRGEVYQRGNLARLSIRNQRSLVQGLDRGEEDLDVRGPSGDPWAGECPQLPTCVDADLSGGPQLFGESLADEEAQEVCQDLADQLNYGVIRLGVTDDVQIDWQGTGDELYPGVRELNLCEVTAFLGSLETRNIYRLRLGQQSGFTMELRGLHQAPINGVTRTRLCELRWNAPTTAVACEAASE